MPPGGPSAIEESASGRSVPELESALRLLEAIHSAQSRFRLDRPPSDTLSDVLASFLDLTSSKLGFIGEVLEASGGGLYLKTRAMTDAGWNAESRALHARNAGEGLDFHNLNTLFGEVIRSGKLVISNAPVKDPRSGGTPTGHPTLRCFLGLPLRFSGSLCGVVGLANRPGGYDERLEEHLAPLLVTCGQLIGAYRAEAKEKALRDQETRRMKCMRSQQATLLSLSKDPAINNGEMARAIPRITEAAAHALGVERASIWFYDAGRRAIICKDLFEVGTGKHSSGVEVLARDYPAYFQALDLEELTIDASDAHRDPRTAEFSATYLRPLGIGAMLDAPIRLRGKTIGVLCNEKLGGPREWTSDERQFAASLATMITLTLEANERAEAERTRQLQVAASEGALDGMAILSPAGKYVYVNGAFLQLFAYPSASELIGQPWRVLYEDSVVARLESDAFAALRRVGRWRGEVTGRRRDGSSFEQELALGLLEDGSISSVVRDITERNRFEAELRHAKEAAEAASVAKSQFLANISHEIRTPMNGILGMAGIALDTELNAEQRGFLLAIRDSADSLLSIISDVLDFSKIEAGKMAIVPVEFCLRTLLDGATNLFAASARKKGLRLDQEIAADVPDKLYGDYGKLRQVLLNLIGNALKFTEHGGIVVKVRALSRGPGDAQGSVKLSFSVQDSGVGIPHDMHKVVFEPFLQVDSSLTRRHRGSGLGLAISKMLVERMGGSIRVESAPGQGSTFEFVVNLAGKVAEMDGTLQAPGENDLEPPDTSARPSLRILVAEDNVVNQKVILRLLEKRGHRTALAVNGQEALDAIHKERFDVVLMDIQMPVMDGLEAMRRIRALESSSRPPAEPADSAEGSLAPQNPAGNHLFLVALTAHAAREDQERCFAAGADRYLSKPLRIEKLWQVLDEAPRPLEPQPPR